ncbi:hydroxymethylbilane synthase, partial [Clostridium butyricum]
FRGLINRHIHCIKIDSYANAFNIEDNGNKWDNDITKDSPWVWERKYEVDSMCYTVRMIYKYWKKSSDESFFNEDIRDVFISRKGMLFKELNSGAKIGTSSLRRALELKEIRSDIEIVPIRGNVQTRLAKMEEQKLDGIILAAAGLKRLNNENIITEYFDPKIVLPAVAQGALGVECLKISEAKGYFEALEDKNARLTVEAERSFMRALNGDCHSAIG